jgi:hypothetical protein
MITNREESPKKKFKRRYITRLIWLVILLTSLIVLFTLDKLISMSLIGFFVSIGVISNLLLMYVSFDFFSIDAYITIFLSYGIIFIQMMIIPIDISLSTTKNINSRFTKDQMHNFLKLEYMILYWISIILNFVFLRFQLSYWNQGHPTLRERVIATLKSLSKLLMIFGIVFLIILLIAFI